METITFRAMHVYPETLLYPASDNAKALLEFSKRASIIPADLHLVAKIGFKVIIEGHTRECIGMMQRHDIGFEYKEGKVEYKEPA